MSNCDGQTAGLGGPLRSSPWGHCHVLLIALLVLLISFVLSYSNYSTLWHISQTAYDLPSIIILLKPHSEMGKN